MKKELYKEIIRHIVLAQKYSDEAKASDSRYDRALNYNKKQLEIDKAISLISRNNIPQIRFKEETAPDQNGYDSRIIYFNIFFFGEILQVSFHQFKRIKNAIKGTRSIEWDNLNGNSRLVCERLDRRFNLHIIDGREVVDMA